MCVFVSVLVCVWVWACLCVRLSALYRVEGYYNIAPSRSRHLRADQHQQSSVYSLIPVCLFVWTAITEWLGELELSNVLTICLIIAFNYYTLRYLCICELVYITRNLGIFKMLLCIYNILLILLRNFCWLHTTVGFCKILSHLQDTCVSVRYCLYTYTQYLYLYTFIKFCICKALLYA